MLFILMTSDMLPTEIPPALLILALVECYFGHYSIMRQKVSGFISDGMYSELRPF